ncbi:MAG: RNA pseudouridine synthase [Clostridia bacterium]|nr:RNA pseudouridine synthase [Clostridia bacterium]
MIKLLDLRKDLVVIYKPPGTPSQSDPTGSPDAMSLTADMLKGMGEGSRLWLVHRLDRTVGGVLVFARTKEAATELSRLVASGEMEKRYVAVVSGEPQRGEYTDLLYKDARLGKAFVVDRKRGGVKEARLTSTPITTFEGLTLCDILLHTGRFHQIRAQLSSRGTPIVGDGKYGSRVKAENIALHAYLLSFPYRGERVTVRYLPDTSSYPWDVFRDDKFFEVNND